MTISSVPRLSVIIPAFNRIGPLRRTLDSVAKAASRLGDKIEVLLIDDGSEPPLSSELMDYDVGIEVTHIRQRNAGSIAARLTGLWQASGDYVQFLDSDDLVHPEKFIRQLIPQHLAGITISTCELAELAADSNGDLVFRDAGDDAPCLIDAQVLLLALQPVPHAPIYRREHLVKCLQNPLIPPDRRYDTVGDIWILHNLAPFVATGMLVRQRLCAVAPHQDGRFSEQWEVLAIESLLLVEKFMKICPFDDVGMHARRLSAIAAFKSWRRLPRGFSDEFARRTLDIWARNGRPSDPSMGGRGFLTLSSIIGVELAGRILKIRNQTYDDCRTVNETRRGELLLRLSMD